MALASSIDKPGNRANTAPISSSGGSANGTWSKFSFCSAGAKKAAPLPDCVARVTEGGRERRQRSEMASASSSCYQNAHRAITYSSSCTSARGQAAEVHVTR